MEILKRKNKKSTLIIVFTVDMQLRSNETAVWFVHEATWVHLKAVWRYVKVLSCLCAVECSKLESRTFKLGTI